YEKTATHTIDYLYVPFLTMPDSLVTVADSELKSYLNEHDAEYQREATRDLSYVVFDVVPSAQDSAAVREEIRLLAEELKNAENDSLFASINTDGIAPFGTYKPNNFPSWLIDSNTELTEGFVSTPVLDGNTYTVYRISKISEGDEAFVKASHILFKADDESDAAKNAAKAEARRVLNEIKAGADFAEMAAQYGTDGTASRGGDLGWFGENSQFVEEFKEAAFAFRGTGLLSDVVETEFGYHIIKITEAKTSRELKIAVIEKELFVSDETQNEAYRQAELFSQAATDVASFGEQALENTYVVKSANRLGKNDKRLGTIQNGRSVIYWLYNKADVGEVSDVFELENQYVVAVMTGEQEKGTARLEDVRNEISRKVIDQKKASQIMAKLASTSGSYEDRAAAYGTGARAGSSEVNLGSNSITGVGLAPVAVGVACSLDEGESTAAFEVQNGVMMITLRTKAALEELSDYEAYRGVVTNRYASYRRREEPLTFQNIYNALIEKADIEDNRYKFY
ncbi:MAG: peptidylprolyl isomerase, partial [Cyclobacteriaceae bacterium]|nr:peptidylprolyl isomerase [Cyclobacteriaceae bacterium]